MPMVLGSDPVCSLGWWVCRWLTARQEVLPPRPDFPLGGREDGAGKETWEHGKKISDHQRCKRVSHAKFRGPFGFLLHLWQTSIVASAHYLTHCSLWLTRGRLYRGCRQYGFFSLHRPLPQNTKMRPTNPLTFVTFLDSHKLIRYSCF